MPENKTKKRSNTSDQKRAERTARPDITARSLNREAKSVETEEQEEKEEFARENP